LYRKINESDKSIQWAIDKYLRRSHTVANEVDKRSRNRYTKESRKLKYCPECDRVWEICTTGMVHRYDHLPTYGLMKKVCTFCKGVKRVYRKRVKVIHNPLTGYKE